MKKKSGPMSRVSSGVPGKEAPPRLQHTMNHISGKTTAASKNLENAVLFALNVSKILCRQTHALDSWTDVQNRVKSISEKGIRDELIYSEDGGW